MYDVLFVQALMSRLDLVKASCGSCVTTQLQAERERMVDDFVGYDEGIQAVIQNHVFLSANALFFERQCRNGIFNCGHFEVPLMLFYVSQEQDFYSWFDVRTMSKTSHFQQNKNNVIQNACSLALLMQ